MQLTFKTNRLNSPIKKLLVGINSNFKIIFISSIKTPLKVPNAKAPIKLGIIEKSTS